jgi:hypothetical protein
MEIRLRGTVCDPQLENDLGEMTMAFSLSILSQFWIWVGVLVFVPRFRKLIREEKQISNPDRSFYRRNDNDFLRMIFYFVLWCLTPALLFGLWLHITGQLHITRHGA